MIVRLVLGILNGFLADLAFRLNQKLGFSPESWLARFAGKAMLRMYTLGGGIDEGASAIYESWGGDGRRCLETLLATDKLPGNQAFYADILIRSGQE